MRLFRLIKTLGDCRISGSFEDFPLRGVSSDSKDVGKDFIFVAIKGVRRDGGAFIKEAIEKGARVIVTGDKDIGLRDYPGVTFITVDDDRFSLARLADAFYGHPSSKVKVIGITGTNGKTTILYLLEALLKQGGFSSGVIGTVNYRFKGKVMNSKNTTPGPLELQSLLDGMRKSGVDFAVMEVSSHALQQHRVGGIVFHSAIFTNLTQDHLDYHGTMEDYFLAKARLFEGLAPSALAVLNNDDEYGRRLRGLTDATVVTYGIDNPSDVTAGDIRMELGQTNFIFKYAAGKIPIRTPLIGRHNVYNILALAAWGIAAGFKPEQLKAALEMFTVAPGRLERIENNRGISIFVDYAHTEDALRNVISSLRQVAAKSARILVVFGCGGERDKTKRPKMGKVVSELADYAVITSDNPRSEDPALIVEDIKKGIAGNNYEVVLERRAAIARILSLAGAGDVVLLAGKGHEISQIYSDSSVDFDDREVARQCLRQGKS
ncbi:MAG: UDP-N-acetylmuramoyl-L-alanyl-D-glutamate--2,6-diaminopimelate ligase [Candidatus Omnitrophota bacterium]